MNRAIEIRVYGEVFDVGHAEVVVGDPELCGLRQLANATQLGQVVQVPGRATQHVIQDGVEVQAPHEGDEVGSGLVKPEVLVRSGSRLGCPELRIDQQVSELVGEHIEVLPVEAWLTALVASISGFDEAEPGLGIRPVDVRYELEAIESITKMPFDPVADVALPDIQDAANRSVHVRR